MKTWKFTDVSETSPRGSKPRTVTIGTEHELRDELARLAEGEPAIAELTSPEGEVLSIGLGGPTGYAGYTGASGDPPYLSAKGDTNADEPFTEFILGGTLTPIPARNCIPLDRVIDIAVYFYLNRHLPESVIWEED